MHRACGKGPMSKGEQSPDIQFDCELRQPTSQLSLHFSKHSETMGFPINGDFSIRPATTLTAMGLDELRN